ncbi:MAG: class I SAM-dependent methyltransferase [Candidatus Omnitrophica bacterium]|nr:class I SAM-dependent methyltransferase [Candidatus Omnitrophota bacterium]
MSRGKCIYIKNDYKKNSGFLTKTYAIKRKIKPYLIYRYKYRASLAAGIIKDIFNIDNNIRILDLGSADGLALIEMHDLLKMGKYTGIEASEELLGFFPKTYHNIDLIHADILDYCAGTESSSYDFITALAVLEHMEDPMLVFKQAYRILKPRGAFIVTCPNPFWDRLASLLKLQSRSPHLADIDLGFIKAAAKETNFILSKFYPFMWSPVAVLTYANIPISAAFSAKVDNFMRFLKIFNFLFVNQCFVFTKR